MNNIEDKNHHRQSDGEEKSKKKRKFVNSFKKFSFNRIKPCAVTDVESNMSENYAKYLDSPLPVLPPKATYLRQEQLYHLNVDGIQEEKLIFNPADLPPVSTPDICNNISPQNNINVPISKQQNIEEMSPGTQHKFDDVSDNAHKLRRNQNTKYSSKHFQAFEIIPTAFIPETGSTLNLPLALALKEVLDLSHNLQESEIQIKCLISKYIKNETVESDLVRAMSNYSKIQVDNERRTYKLAVAMFFEEKEALHLRAKKLQESLDVAVQMNRSLENNIESLKSETEQVFINFEGSSTNHGYQKTQNEEIHSNNQGIRLKYKLLLETLNKAEENLQNLQCQNQCLITQLGNANGQIRSYRDLLQKNIQDHELEHISLSCQITANEQIIKDCLDAGDVLLEDLNSIKRQMKVLPFAVNWDKFKSRGTGIVDLIHLSRSCINELGRELLNVFSQIRIQNKDKTDKNLEISKLTEALIKKRLSEEQIQSKMENLSTYETKLQRLQSELEMYKKENSIVSGRLYEEKTVLANHENTIKDLNTHLAEKSLLITNLNSTISDNNIEINTLKFQLDSLKKLFEENNLSTVLKELMEAQEKCAYYQGQYHKLEEEKKQLSQQSIKSDIDKDQLMKYQQSFLEHLQAQQKDIETLSTQNLALKDQLVQERSRLVETNAELSKQIQETNLMKTVQTQFNVEYSKNLSMETNALNTNFEMNRLTVVAQYNNEVSKQLKGLIIAKDKTISELKIDLEKLSDIDKKYFEERAALCNELTSASYIIKQLQDKLSAANAKCLELDANNAALQKNAESKIQELHKMVIEERQTLQDLLNDYKKTTEQKINLNTLKTQYLSEISVLKSNEETLTTKVNYLEKKCATFKQDCEKLTESLLKANKTIESKERKTSNTSAEYENKLSSRDTIIENLKCKNIELEKSIQYLQCTIQNLQKGVNISRKNEKKYQSRIQDTAETITKYQQCIDEQKVKLEQFNTDYKIIEQKLHEIESRYNSVIIEYNEFIKQTNIKEEKMKKDLQQYKDLNIIKAENIKNLVMDSKEKLSELELNKAECDAERKKLKTLEETYSAIIQKYRLQEQSLHKQMDIETKLLKEKENYENKIEILTETVKNLKNELRDSIKKRKTDLQRSKQYILEYTKAIQQQKIQMVEDLDNVSAELTKMNKKYIEKCNKLDNLKHDYRIFAEHMSKTLSTLAEEKDKHENNMKYNSILKKELLELTSKLLELNNLLQIASEVQLEKACVAVGIHAKEKELQETKKLLVEAQNEICILETELAETNQKLQALQELAIAEKSYALNELKKRADLLQKADVQIIKYEDNYNAFKEQLSECHHIISQLKNEISELHPKIHVLEFQKCELTLRLHELKTKLRTNHNLNLSYRASQQHLSGELELRSTEFLLSQSVTENLMLTLENSPK